MHYQDSFDLPGADSGMPTQRAATILCGGYAQAMLYYPGPPKPPFGKLSLAVKPYTRQSSFLLSCHLLDWQVEPAAAPLIWAGLVTGFQHAALQGHAGFSPITGLELIASVRLNADSDLSDPQPFVQAAAEGLLAAFRQTHLVEIASLDVETLQQAIPLKPPELMQLEAASGWHFVGIPAGTYIVGAGDNAALSALEPSQYRSKAYTTPQQQVTLPAFFIARELLRAQHIRRLRASAFGPALQQALPRLPRKQDVLVVPDTLAKAIAHALGLELPTWAQWEVATRGPSSFLYPWGNTFDVERVSVKRHTTSHYWEDPESTMGLGRDQGWVEQQHAFFPSFGGYADAQSPFGLIDLARIGTEWNTLEPQEGSAVRSLCDLELSPYGCTGTTLAALLPATPTARAAFRLVYQHP